MTQMPIARINSIVLVSGVQIAPEHPGGDYADAGETIPKFRLSFTAR